MPKNKHALIRYRVINRCLIDYEFCSREFLIEACERALDIAPLGERTFDQDIADMRYDNRLGFHAPIRFSRRHGGYYYDYEEQPGYSIDRIPVSRVEIDALTFASSLLGAYRETGVFSRFSGAVRKVVDAVNIQKAHFDEPEFDFIDFEHVPFYRGSDFLETIIQAIQAKRALEVEHQSFDSPEREIRVVHPYLLKEYRNRWYLLGHDDVRDEIRIFALDRIHGIEPAVQQYREQDFDAAEYFRNTVGVISPGGEPPEILIAVRRRQANYLLTQPWHGSQSVASENAGEVVFRFRVHPTYEFRSLVLGLGKDARVITPEQFRDEMVEEVRQISDQYKK